MIWLFWIYLIGSAIVFCVLISKVADKWGSVDVRDVWYSLLCASLSWVTVLFMLFDKYKYKTVWKRKQ